MIKYVWVVFTLSMLAGLYFTNPPSPGESAMHYIMQDTGQTWQSFCCIVIAGLCGSFLLMYYTMREK